MSFFKKINAVATAEDKEIKKSEELERGQLYPIKALKIVNGKYGEIPLVEFKDFAVFLPKRMTKVVEENLEELNNGKFGLVYLDKFKMDVEIGHVSTTSLNLISNAFKLLSANFCPHASKVWLNLIKKNIRLSQNLLKKSTSIGTKKKIIAIIGQLKRYQLLINNLCVKHVGGGTLKTKRSDRIKWLDLTTAFKSIIINIKHLDPLTFLNDAFYLFQSRIKNILKSIPLLKVNTSFRGEFLKIELNNEIKYFSTKNIVIDGSVNLKNWFQDNVVDKILNKLSEFSEKDSGWALKKVLSLEININKYEVGNGSSFIRLPEEIAKKHACVNVKNYDDDACFTWAVTSALHQAKTNNDRTSSYPHYEDVLNFANIKFPISIQDISKFEKLNSISINVYTLELIKTDKTSFLKTVPSRLTKNKLDKHINLLCIQNKYYPNERDSVDNDEDEDTIIKIKLTDHEEYCKKLNQCKISFPKEKSICFKNFKNKESAPFILYADVESILLPISDNNNLKSHKYQEHKAFSVGYYLKCKYDDNLSYFKSYRGLDCMEWFAKEIEDISKFIQFKMLNIIPLNTNVDLKYATKQCHICNKNFIQGDVIVRDHCHFSGNFRGFAHQICNLNYNKKFVVPIVFHNFSGYDSHFIIQDIAKYGKITLLPINKEKYISFTWFDHKTKIQFRFIDSFRFMASSLDKLSSYLTEYPILNREFANLSVEKIKLLERKGVFPYDFIDSEEKLKYANLPSKKYFYNKLNDCDISAKDYSHALKIWNTFNIKDLGEYSDLYLKTDILLLADVFEQFRESCLKTYQLDPAHYYTLPGYTWDCMLKITECKPDTIQCVDMLLFIEQGIRGGVSQCCNRYAEANNKYMGDAFDGSKPSNYLLYLDVNNLYGWAMSQYLPYGGFKWADPNLDVTQIPDDAPEGYFLEVDLEYPQHLHDLHKDLPLCPEHQKPPNSKLSKLMTTLHNKTKYVIHYRNLKQVLKQGLVLTKIHRVLKFGQSPWLKSYIDLNTNLRQNAKNEFEKNLFKLMNNAVFGKTMENIRKHRIVKLVNKWEDTDSLIYEFTCNDVYDEVIHKDIHRFDTSDYPQDNKWNIPLVNKKIPGLMKDELNGEIITHFVGLRSKMYTYKTINSKCIKKSKGVKYNVVKSLTFNDYLECLRKKTNKNVIQRIIKSNAHNVYSIEQSKIGLSAYDDKRHLLLNSDDTLPHGHFSIALLDSM
ncbi:unnamed protein product [Brassicogethes aeneus]|uniref:DNA-directed DNA polymerase n=1 Tax=Brassicogethes aeneus TaxID=1431903 RepID=A0A9P0B518_BRAAE|nr:unnamed protein product [Brassicogethes aeneus]